MRNLKFSFSFIVAILAVGFTVASKASSFNSKAVTDCFLTLTVGNANGTSQTVVRNSDGTIELSCDEAIDAVSTQPYVYNADALSFFSDPDNQCPRDVEQYCCVKVTPAVGNPSGVPLLNLGDGIPRKYQVTEVICKPQQ